MDAGDVRPMNRATFRRSIRPALNNLTIRNKDNVLAVAHALMLWWEVFNQTDCCRYEH